MLGGPVQIAYAVGDVDRSISSWVAGGVGPFFLREHIELSNVRIRGHASRFDHSSAFAQWGDVMIELIHQHDGGDTSIVGTAGIHHVAHFVDDFSAATAGLRAAGRDEVLYAETATGMPFAFHDALADRGHLIEIYEHTAPLRRFYDMVRNAGDDWDGTDPVRRL